MLPQVMPALFGARYLAKVLSVERQSLVGFWPQNERSGSISYDYSGLDHHGAYTGPTLGQPGVPGMGMTSPFFDGVGDYNDIYSPGLANDSTLLNGGFETPGGGGADIWANYTETAGDGALANEVVIVHQGTDSAKMTSGVTSNTNVFGDAMVSVPGDVRRFRFYTYGDGVNASRYAVYDITNGAYITPITSTGITAAAWGMIAAQYIVPVGCISVRIEYWCPPVNGGVCYFDAGEVRRMDGFLGDQGTILTWPQVANAGVWTDAAWRQLVGFRVGVGNLVALLKRNAANSFTWQYTAATVSSSITNGAMARVDFFVAGMTWDISAGATGEMRAYQDGIQEGATQVGLGTWVGDLDNTRTVIGAETTAPVTLWHGNVGPVPQWNKALDPDQMAYVSTL